MDEFLRGCAEVDIEGKGGSFDFARVFNFLDNNHTGELSEPEFLMLRAFSSNAVRGPGVRLKAFVAGNFDSAAEAWQAVQEAWCEYEVQERLQTRTHRALKRLGGGTQPGGKTASAV